MWIYRSRSSHHPAPKKANRINHCRTILNGKIGFVLRNSFLQRPTSPLHHPPAKANRITSFKIMVNGKIGFVSLNALSMLPHRRHGSGHRVRIDSRSSTRWASRSSVFKDQIQPRFYARPLELSAGGGVCPAAGALGAKTQRSLDPMGICFNRPVREPPLPRHHDKLIKEPHAQTFTEQASALSRKIG